MTKRGYYFSMLKIFSLVPTLILIPACGDSSSDDPDPDNENPGVPTGTSTGSTTGTSTGSTTGTSTGSTTGTSTGSTTGTSTGSTTGTSTGSTTGTATGMPAPECGNGTAEEGEDCDGSDFDGQSCSSLGFSAGDLACNDSCETDTSSCTSSGTLETEVRTFCDDTCRTANDGVCRDGGPNADGFPSNQCEFGTDCTDCGSQDFEIPIVSGGGKASCDQPSFGDEVGDPVENWTTFNQHGAAVSLSDQCGKWVYIELGRLSCPVCIRHLGKLQKMADELGNYKDGLVVINTHHSNLNPLDPNPTSIPSQAEIVEWLDEYTNDPDWYDAAESGVWNDKVHVVSDANHTIWDRYFTSVPLGRTPQAMLINPDGEIVGLRQADLESIRRQMDRW